MSVYSDRLYDHFQQERSVFNRYVLAVVSLGVFFAFVFEPYLATLAGLVHLDRDLAKRSEQIAVAKQGLDDATAGIERATEFMGDASDYQRLYDDTESWISDFDEIEQLYDRRTRIVASLRRGLSPEDNATWPKGSVPAPRLVNILRETRPDMMQNYERGDDCFFLVEDAWVGCQVDRNLAPIRERLERVLYDRTTSHEYTRILEKSIEENRLRFQEGIDEATARAELGEWVREYLEKEQKIIRNWYENMARERLRLDREAKDQQALKTQLESERNQLELRKREISAAGNLDTPIGTLPLSFHDILGFLPLVLLVTGTLMLRSHRRLLVLRAGFQNHGPASETAADALALTMPLWPDPHGSKFARLVAHAFLLVPVMTALLGAAQLAVNSRLVPGGSQLKVAGILLATLVVFAAYVGLYVSVVTARRRCP